MKKLSLYLGAIFLLANTSLFALLPPVYESIKEIQTVLENPIFSKFSGEVITAITKKETGYQVETTNYIFFAEIKILPPSKIGPLEFTVSFQTPIKK